MKRHLLAAAAAVLIALPAAAQELGEPEMTVGKFHALPDEQRTLYLAGLADMLDLAAAMVPHDSHLPVIASCTNGFTADELFDAVENGARDMQQKWPDNSPAASWFVATMIWVCQLQLPPPAQ